MNKYLKILAFITAGLGLFTTTATFALTLKADKSAQPTIAQIGYGAAEGSVSKVTVKEAGVQSDPASLTYLSGLISKAVDGTCQQSDDCSVTLAIIPVGSTVPSTCQITLEGQDYKTTTVTVYKDHCTTAKN